MSCRRQAGLYFRNLETGELMEFPSLDMNEVIYLDPNCDILTINPAHNGDFGWLEVSSQNGEMSMEPVSGNVVHIHPRRPLL